MSTLSHFGCDRVLGLGTSPKGLGVGPWTPLGLGVQGPQGDRQRLASCLWYLPPLSRPHRLAISWVLPPSLCHICPCRSSSLLRSWFRATSFFPWILAAPPPPTSWFSQVCCYHPWIHFPLRKHNDILKTTSSQTSLPSLKIISGFPWLWG